MCFANFPCRFIRTYGQPRVTGVRMAELSLSERLRIVSDPRPAEFNPDEEDWDLLSGTRLSQSRTYDDQGTSHPSATGRKGGVSSRLRAHEEVESDPRYAGRPVTRREFFGFTENGWFLQCKSQGGLWKNITE